MKIAILLPHLHSGGAERVCINLANEFIARGYAVDMVLMRASGELLPLLDPEVQVVDLGAGNMRTTLRPLIRYLRKMRPTSMLACMWPLTTVAVVARLVSGRRTRLVVAEHTTWSSDGWYGRLVHRLILWSTMRLLYSRADGVVTVSKGAADDLAGISHLPGSRITTIYNPIVGGARVTANEEVCIPSAWAEGAHARILAVGRLKIIKDYPTLLRAFAILCRKVDARLLLLGEGDERESLEQLIKDLDIQELVSMPGFSSSTEGFYRKADLLVLSSVGEGLPTVIVEALEHGVPVVSTDCRSGPREILMDGQFGRLVQVGDEHALAQAMSEALEETPDRAALMARAQEFSVSKATDAYERVLLGELAAPRNGWASTPEHSS